LFQLVSIGVGGTIGSGIMVLCGVIARDYAGPATCLSWAISGVAAFLSGSCYAELSGRIHDGASAYSYAFATMGELPAFVTFGCLTLEYMIAGAAVARSWGDKVVEWLQMQLHAGSWVEQFLVPGYGISPCACFLSLLCTLLLLSGLNTSKIVTDVFTWLKVSLVLFMTIAGLCLMDTSNLRPFIPPQYGIAGVIRGATSSFFGYLGYDGVCCVASEAINPQTNVPKAVLITLAVVTVLYILAALSLTGMVPYIEISPSSGFPEAFHYRGFQWIAQITAAGEIITLPLVVLICLMLQTRLQYAVARDGLLPTLFHEVHKGSPVKGTVAAGILMTLISLLVPFTYLNDFISAGILVAFSATNSSLIFIRLESPNGQPFYLEKMISLFHVFSFISNMALVHLFHFKIGRILCIFLVVGTCAQGWLIRWRCPTSASSLDPDINTKSQDRLEPNKTSQLYFTVPFVPFIPLLGIFFNYFLIAQLELLGISLLLIYIALLIVFYFFYGFLNSVANNQGRREYEFIKGGYTPVVT
jgi:APA family basic amino acid/polyamine antiporter